MSSLTFGSVGDIIAVCGIIQQVVQALSDTRGSAPECVIEPIACDHIYLMVIIDTRGLTASLPLSRNFFCKSNP